MEMKFPQLNCQMPVLENFEGYYATLISQIAQFSSFEIDMRSRIHHSIKKKYSWSDDH